MSLLIASGGPLAAGAAVAQDSQAQGAAMIQYQTDSGCAAAAAAWLIGMPNGTPEKEQQDTLSVWVFFTARAQTAAETAGRPTFGRSTAAEAFLADALPHLKSPDAAEAAKARDEAAKGTHDCAALPDFRSAATGAKP